MTEEMTQEAKEVSEYIFKIAAAGKAVLGLDGDAPDSEYTKSVIEELNASLNSGERFEGKTLREDVKEYLDKIKDRADSDPDVIRSRKIASAIYMIAKAAKEGCNSDLIKAMKQNLYKDLCDEGLIDSQEEGELKN